VSQAAPAGYSGKSLADKLGVKDGVRLWTLNAPDHYAELIGTVDASMEPDAKAADILHVFVLSRADLFARAGELTTTRRPGAALWISWPKKSSPLFVDLTEGGVREAILPTGWVDVKVCAVDADWSGLKFLRRRT
jgi:hypothetical protein